VANEQVTVRFAAEIQQYQANVKQAQKILQSFGISAEQESSRVSKSVASMLAQYASLAVAVNTVKNVVKEGIDFNSFKETSTAAFGTMMKSITAAKTTMVDLFNFAVNSPLTFKETVTASKQLMAYGFEVKELIPTIQMLGTVGKATGVTLADMSYVYGTLKSQGRAYTRDLMQFAMRGIPIYEELGKVMGVPVAQLQKMTEAGKIGFKEVEKAFQNMTTGTGKFAGYFDEYMKTFEGKMSMLTDIAQQSSGILTESLFNVLKKNVDDFINILKNNKDQIASVGKDLGNLASAFFDIVKAILPLLPLLIKLIPLLIAKSVLSSGIKLWKALPETFNMLGASVGLASSALKTLAINGAVVPGMVSSFAMLSRSVTGFGSAFAAALPAIIAIAVPIAAIAAAIAVVVALVNKAKEDEIKFRTDAEFTTKTISEGSKGQNYTVLSLQSQVDLVHQLQQLYPACYDDVANILLANKAISKEAANQVNQEAASVKGLNDYINAQLKILDNANATLSINKQQSASIASTMGISEQSFQVKDVAYFDWSGRTAAAEFIKGFTDAASANDDIYKSLGIKVPEKDIEADAQKELDAIVGTIATLKSAIGENGEKLFPNIESYGFFQLLATEAQKLQAILDSLKKGGSDKAISWIEREMAAKYTAESNFVDYQLDDIQLTYDKQRAEIIKTAKTEEWSWSRIRSILSMNEKLRAQEIKENDQQIREKRQGYENEIRQMQQDTLGDELAGIMLTYDTDLQNAQNKAINDKMFALKYDEYVRALTAKRDKDLAKQTYTNLTEGKSSYWENKKVESGGNYATGDSMLEIAKSEKSFYLFLGAMTSYLKAAGEQLSTQVLAGSEVGNMQSNGFSGAGILSSGVTALADFLLSIENVNKVLNPFSTILESAKDILEPMINSVLSPIVDILEEVGTVVGQVVAPFLNIFGTVLAIVAGILDVTVVPILQLLGKAFAWLNDSVIVPFGNGIIDIINSLITFINDTFGTNIKLIAHLLKTTEATTTATVEQQTDLLNDALDGLNDTLDDLNGAFDALKNAAQDLVDSQVSSLQDLYEVGAITGAEYDSQVKALNDEFEKYFSDGTYSVIKALGENYSLADVYAKSAEVKTQIANVNDQITVIQGLLDKLSDTNEPLSQGELQGALDSTNSVVKAASDSIISGMSTSTASVVESILALGSSISQINGTANTPGGASIEPTGINTYASGTNYVPQDMVAQIHKGEKIIPADFSSAIDRGEITLGGGGSSGGNITVQVNVQGSVSTEKDIAKSIANTMYQLRRAGELTV